MVDQVDPLDPNTPYVQPNGTFGLTMRLLWQTAMGRLVRAINDITAVEADVADAAAAVAAIKGASFVTIGNDATLTAERSLVATPGDLTLTDGGANSTAALGLAATAVTPGTYGDASHVARVTFDAKGRATSVSEVAIADAGSWIPLVTGAEPAQLVSNGAGQLVLIAYP